MVDLPNAKVSSRSAGPRDCDRSSPENPGGILQFAPFRIAAMSLSFRLEKSCIRFKDSSADNLSGYGRRIRCCSLRFSFLATYDPSEGAYFDHRL